MNRNYNYAEWTNRNYDYAEWMKAENMEMSMPLCELWLYSDRVIKNRSRACTIKRKIAGIFYCLADKLCVEADKLCAES